MNSVTLQISLSPSDFPHAQHILPHQLKQFSEQVDEILLVTDKRRSRGRFGVGWLEGEPKLKALLESCCRDFGHARTVEVDYSPAAMKSVGVEFFGVTSVPIKDYRGGPYYSYFYALHASRNSYVFHLDSDMLFGGGSQTWIGEALAILASPDVFSCDPLPGPPRQDGALPRERATLDGRWPGAFRIDGFGTRVFLIDKERLVRERPKLSVNFCSGRAALSALLHGWLPYNAPENNLRKAMVERKLLRISFLGNPPGLWSLHPPNRTSAFYAILPDLISRIESGDIPDAQRGDYDLNLNLYAAEAAGPCAIPAADQADFSGS